MVKLSPPPKRHCSWGQIDHTTTIADGIEQVSTPSHGGFILSEERQKEMHPALRRQGNEYEEDCEWALVVINFPQFFKEEQIKDAHLCAQEWNPRDYMKFTGTKLELKDSHVLREEEARKANANKYVTMAAWGDWHKDVPMGMVGVFAGRGGRMKNGMYPDDCKYFLVPETEYDNRDDFGFVIDEAKHKACSPIH